MSDAAGHHAPMGIGLGTAAGIIAADQGSKWWASATLAGSGIPILPGYFDLELVHNVGAAFGLFTGLDPVWRVAFLVGVAVAATVLLLAMLWRSTRLWTTLAIGLVLGGALGNLIDRLRLGWVVDFLHVHWHDLSWPVFNLADSAISVGVAMLLWDGFKTVEETPEHGQ